MKTKWNRAFMVKANLLLITMAVLVLAGCGTQKNTTKTNNESASAVNNVVAETAPVAEVVDAVTDATAQVGQLTEVLSAAETSGKEAGNSLKALYNQYKADGTFDYKNFSNILNTVNLIGNCEGLKDNYKDLSYLKDFGKGLISGSLGLINQENAESVTNSLVDMVKGSETAQKVTSTAGNVVNSVSQYAGAIGNILSLFNK